MTAAGVVLVVHGGAGVISPEAARPKAVAACRAGLGRALLAGFRALTAPGGSSLDAVEAAIRVLEDDPSFNAGRGAVFNRDGRHELDAAIMSGRDLRAGAVAGLTRAKNPITAARRVMDASGHVFLAGPGADLFVDAQGLETVAPDYYRTGPRWVAYQDAIRNAEAAGPADRSGTVGAVALDRAGDLAAGSSTGGTTAKRPGLVGDSPVVGAGLYAANGVCAVSCTGDGEAFLRLAAAHEVVALVRYAGLTPAEAAVRVVHQTLRTVGGAGGVITLGPDGRFAAPFNTPGMYRGWITSGGRAEVAVLAADAAPPPG